jgi:predicted amidophosphoribosyltransferase
MDDQELEPGTVDFSQHAGLVVFPRSAAELTDTTLCPACFTPLPGTVCESCGLDLGHPAAFQLLRHSQDAAQLLRARVTTIGRMRYETA